MGEDRPKRERERDKDIESQRQRERKTKTERDTERDKDRDTNRNRDRERQRQRQRDRERQTHRKTETERDRDRQTDRQTDRQPHVSTTSTCPVQHPCFETAQLTITYSKQLTNLFRIYRPPPNKKNKFSESMYFDQFSDFLNTLTVCLAKHSLWVTLIFILKT